MKKIPVFPIGYGWMVKMKLFDKYFQPYAEYCLRTTFSEDELKEALVKECPATSDVLSWKAIKAAMGLSKTIVSCDPDDPLLLLFLRTAMENILPVALGGRQRKDD